MSILDDLDRVLRSLPPNPVAPENRGLARLRASAYVPRGQVYRLASQPDITGDNRPTILMNQLDIELIARVFCDASPFGFSTVNGQVIADIAEQLFAEQEAKGR
jgi:hypothetical protein